MSSRLIGYEVQRLGIIKIFSIDIGGRHITKITGANGQGKSTALKALEMLLDTRAVPQEPIQHGQEKAQIVGKFETDKGEIIVKKTFTKQTPRGKLQVSIDGIWQKSPQTLLDELLGLISFNPLDFCEADPDEQKEMLLTLLGLSEEINTINSDYEKLYDLRTEVHRDARRIRQDLERIPKVDEVFPINILDVIEQRQKAIAHNTANDKLTEELKVSEQKIVDLGRDDSLYSNQLQQVQKQIAELLEREEFLKETLDGISNDLVVEKTRQGLLQKQVNKLVYKDITTYDRQLNQVEEHNTKAHYWKERVRLDFDLNVAKTEIKRIEDTMEALTAKKATLLAEASFPIPGLSFTEEGVRYNGTLVSDISKAQKLLVGCAVMSALNPTLRLVLMDDAEKLDSASLKMIEDWATENDLYVLMAMVNETGNVGIVFQDGEVIADEYK